VPQVEVVDGRAVLLFSCLGENLSSQRQGRSERGGVWTLTADSVLGPLDLTHAQPLTGPELYSGRIIRDRSDRWVLLAFHNLDDNCCFIGALSDPMPVAWGTGPAGRAVLVRR
jgi:beta-fructofuranosidase